MHMNYRIFIGLCFLIVAACLFGSAFSENLASSSTAVTVKQISLKIEEAITPEFSSNNSEEAFLQFIYQLTQLTSINSSDQELWQSAQRFLPETRQHKSHNLSVQWITHTDSIFLLFYDYRQVASDEGNMYLGSFTKDGKLLDQLPLNDISFDGTFSVHKLEQNILELVYRDFSMETFSFTPHEFEQAPDVYATDMATQSRMTERTRYQYYEINDSGSFSPLSKISFPESDRIFPQASERLLSKDELIVLDESDLQMMRFEIQASYGYIFEEEFWLEYFSEKNWYEARVKNIDQQLSDVERINLNKIMAVEASL